MNMLRCRLIAALGYLAFAAFVAADPPPQYLIVTSQELAGPFAELAAYRGSNGYAASIVTLTDITNAYPTLDTPAGIRCWTRDTGLTTTNDILVIGGDQDIVPARLCQPNAGGEIMPTDLYFTDMSPATWDADGDGVFGENGDVTVSNLSPIIAVGRIPVRTPDQARAYVAKLLRYETAVPTAVPSSMLLLGGGGCITGTERPADFRYHESVCDREIAQMSLYRDLVQPQWQEGPLHWFFGSASTWDQNRYGDYPLIKPNLMARLNEPHLYLAYSGHSNRKRWFFANFSRDDLLRLTNAFPFINLPGGCGTCYHDDLDDPCMSEAALRNPVGGAVVWFGFVRSTSGGTQREALFEHLFRRRNATLGQVHAAALRAVAASYVRNPYPQFNLVLHGDPAVRPPGPPTGRHFDLLCPRGAEVVALGDPFIIRWNAWGTGFVGNEHVRLEYSTNGTTWQVVPGAEALPFNARAHTWETAALPASPNYRVRLTSLEYPDLAVTSPSFRVVPCGLLTVRAHPVPALPVGGLQGNTTDYDISVPFGDSAELIGPAVRGVQFEAWRDGAGVLLSTNPNFTFAFTGSCTRVANYTPLQETIYYVNDDVAEFGIAPGNDANDGRTPATPMRSIQALLDRYPSAGLGAIVFISEGTFEENLVLAQSHAGLVLRGAGRAQTIIDGRQRGSCLDAQAWQVGRLEHLCLENGMGTSHGGAIQMSGSSMTIVDCLFDGNTAQAKGGAIYTSESWADCDLIVQDSEFVDNNANRGGVVYTAKAARIVMTNCVFRGNHSAAGGGAFQICVEGSTELTDCLFEDNSTPDVGGAIRHSSSRSSTVQRCRFNGNSAYSGGAIHISDTGGMVLSNCTFTTNDAVSGGAVGGGGPFSATSCTFANNAATEGGALCWDLRGNFMATNCLFADNLASTDGGAMAVDPDGSSAPALWFQDCRFTQNQSEDQGGVVYAFGGDLEFSSCLFASNHAAKAGVLFTSQSPSVRLRSCRVEYNTADYSGVMRLTGVAPQVRCTDCAFVNNTSIHEGGVLNGHANSLLELNRCQLTGNSSDTGGALRVRNAATVRATDSLLARNRATTGLGGAVYAYEGGNFQAVGCTLADNESADKGGAVAWSSTGTLTLTNSILFHNDAPHGSENLYQASSGTVQLGNLCTTPAPTNGFGHITNAPLFVDYASGNLRLQSNSPCINAGNNASAPGPVDLDGNPRIAGGTVDIGAYEFQSPASTLSYAWAQQFGLPTDGSADFADTDLDGHNNWQEWRTDTVPTNALSQLALLAPIKGPNGVAVTWKSVPTRSYFLERGTNVAGPPPIFAPVTTGIPGQSGLTTFTDTTATNGGPFFYRVGAQ